MRAEPGSPTSNFTSNFTVVGELFPTDGTNVLGKDAHLSLSLDGAHSFS